MVCAEFSKLLDEYESLDVLKKAELKEHAASCEECRMEYELFMSMLDATRTFPPIKVDDDFLTSLNARIDKEVVAAPVHKTVWEHLKLNVHRYSAVAACVALIAVIGVNSTDFIEKLTNPYQEYIEPATVVESIEDETEQGTETDASTAEPTPSATPAQSEQPTASPKATATATPKPATATPKATAAPRATATPKPTQTQKPSVVFEQTPANSPEPTPVPEVSATPATTSEPYTVEPGQYVLPASADPKEGRSIQGQGYSISNTANYLKVSQADSEKVRHIVSRYSQDAQDGVYLMTEESMESILQILAQEGIEFDDSITTAADGNVAFKLIIS